MRKDRKPLLRVIAVMTLVFAAVLGIGSLQPGKTQSDHWQLVPEKTVTEVPAGFAGLAFTDADVEDAEAAFFRLTPDDKTGILHAYVPAEMEGKALHLQLNRDQALRIEGEGLDAPAENESEKTRDQSGAGVWRAGQTLPSFAEGAEYSFTIEDAQGQAAESETVVFHYTQNVPSMFIETKSGSMEAADSDKHHETGEDAVYRIYQTDGTPDASGRCEIKGRGNSTWSLNKKPYNLNLARENSLLGMDSCSRLALIANFWDSTQTRQYYAFEAAARLGLEYTPQTRFVNVYLNGKYHGICLLTQRLNVNGGTVRITDLDAKNNRANVTKDTIGTTVMDTDEEGHEALAYAFRNEPDNLTGGYLIEFEDRYEKENLWFATETEHMAFKSPQKPSVGEYRYISSYVREAEAVLFGTGGAGTVESGASETGAEDPDRSAGGSGDGAADAGSVWDYFDMDSWARMYLIQDFFVQSDDEYYSFFFYKKENDPLLYCGPVWDFDLCLGNMNCGDYYRTSAQTLWLRDGRKKWLHQMDQYPEFRARVAELYLEELEPVIRDMLDNEYDQTVEGLEKDTKLNYLRWHKDLDYSERTGLVRTFLHSRVDFLHDYYTDPGSYHRLLFHFAWGDFSYYVRDGESMGFLPTYDYGEKQSSVQREANGFITGWQDTADGSLLQPDTPVYGDREFDPVYIP